MTTPLFIHGYNASAGETSVDPMRCLGWPDGSALDFDYRFLNGPLSGLLGVRLLNNRRAHAAMAMVAEAGKSRIDIVAHSNGCDIAFRIMDLSPWLVRRVVLINPALDVDRSLPGLPEKAYCLHTPGELPTRAASWLPFHPWGRAGSEGLKDERVINLDTSDREVYGPYSSESHSDKFGGTRLYFWTTLVKELLDSDEP